MPAPGTGTLLSTPRVSPGRSGRMSVRPAREGNAGGDRHHMENPTPVFLPWSSAASSQHSHWCPLGRARIQFRAAAQGSAWSFMLPAQTCPQSWHTPAGGRDPWRSHLGDTTLLCSQAVTLRAKEWPIPNLGGLRSRGRAQAATTEGKDCRDEDISFSQPKPTLKGQNPQTVPKSQGWRWEGTAAWQ